MNDLETRLEGALRDIAGRAPDVSLAAIGQPRKTNRKLRAPILAAGAVAVIVAAVTVMGGVGDNERQRDLMPTDGRSVGPRPVDTPPVDAHVLDSVADGLAAFETLAGYGSTQVNYVEQRVTLQWKGRLPSVVEDAVERAPSGVEVVIIPVPYAGSELSAAASRIMSAARDGRLHTKVAGITYQAGLVGLDAQLVTPVLDTMADLEAIADVPVTITEVPTMPSPLFD